MFGRSLFLAALVSCALGARAWTAEEPMPVPAPESIGLPDLSAGQSADSRVREPERTLLRSEPSDVIEGPLEALPQGAVLEPVAEPGSEFGPPGIPDGGCGTVGCGGGCPACCVAPCGPSGRFWVRAEYLQWWTKGMYLPPLVTTSPASPVLTPREEAGVLGFPDTEILYPIGGVLRDSRSGFRIRAGTWLEPCRRFGVEAEYFGLGTISDSFSASSNAQGRPILARPFFNMNPRINDPTDPNNGQLDPPARQDSELVSYPDELEGTVTVDTYSSLDSVAAHFRVNLCCKSWCWQDPCNPCCTAFGGSRFDFLVGYRFVRLREGVSITEDLTSLSTDPALQGDFDIRDSFETSNDFHGCEVGVLWELRHNCWFVEALGKMALGNNHQVVDILGTTVVTPAGGAPMEYTGGLLAQGTNIGSHISDDFAVVPQLGLTLGYRVTPRMSVTFGYTFFYWSVVARPGEQIDLDVNPDLLPPREPPVLGPARPRFVYDGTDFWAQGINLGLDYRW